MPKGILNIDKEDTQPKTSAFERLGVTEEDIDIRLRRLERDRNVFANLFEESAGTDISLVTAGVFYPWVSSERGEETGAPEIHTNISDSNIVVGQEGGGFYYINISTSFSGSNNSGIHGAIFLDGAEKGEIEFHRKLAGSDLGNGAASGLLRLVPGNILSLRFSSNTNTTTLTVEHVHLTAFRLRKENLI